MGGTKMAGEMKLSNKLLFVRPELAGKTFFFLKLLKCKSFSWRSVYLINLKNKWFICLTAFKPEYQLEAVL